MDFVDWLFAWLSLFVINYSDDYRPEISRSNFPPELVTVEGLKIEKQTVDVWAIAKNLQHLVCPYNIHALMVPGTDMGLYR